METDPAIFTFHMIHAIIHSHHYSEVMMTTVASQITSVTIVYSTVYSDADQRKHQSSASLAFVRGIHRGPGNSPHKWPVTRKMFPFDDVILYSFPRLHPLALSLAPLAISPQSSPFLALSFLCIISSLCCLHPRLVSFSFPFLSHLLSSIRIMTHFHTMF